MTAKHSEEFHRGNRSVRASLTATVVPASSTNMLGIDCKGLSRVMIHLTGAVAALTGLALKAYGHPDGVAAVIADAAADFTAPAGIIVGTDGSDLTTLNAADGWVLVDVLGIEKLEIWATSGGTATLAIQAGGH